MYGNNYNNGPTKRPPPMGRAGSRALREKQSNSNLSQMFNSNSAVQNIPSHDMNRFRNMQNQMQPQNMQELEHWRNQSMYLMQQMQQMQEKMQMMQQHPSQPPSLVIPNQPGTAVAQTPLPPRPPMQVPPTPAAATSVATAPAAAMPVAGQPSAELHAALNGIAELRNVVRSMDARIQQLTAQYNDAEGKIIELYKYLNEWNAALQDPLAPSGSSNSATSSSVTANEYDDSLINEGGIMGDVLGSNNNSSLLSSGMSDMMDQTVD